MTTPRLSLTEIAVGQTFKEIAHNEALRAVDAFMSGRAISRSLTTPPGSPAEGDVYIVPASGAAGAWSGQANKIAQFYGATWVFYTPKTGMTLWLDSAGGGSLSGYFVYYTGSVWSSPPSSYTTVPSIDANQTLTAFQSESSILRITGAQTAQRDYIVPHTVIRKWDVLNLTTGGFAIRIIGATGTGITIANARAASVYTDATNVVRLTPDSVLT